MARDGRAGKLPRPDWPTRAVGCRRIGASSAAIGAIASSQLRCLALPSLATATQRRREWLSLREPPAAAKPVMADDLSAPPVIADALALALVAASDAPILLLSGELGVVAASASFCQAFQIDPATIEGASLFAIGAGEWDAP